MVEVQLLRVTWFNDGYQNHVKGTVAEMCALPRVYALGRNRICYVLSLMWSAIVTDLLFNIVIQY